MNGVRRLLGSLVVVATVAAGCSSGGSTATTSGKSATAQSGKSTKSGASNPAGESSGGAAAEGGGASGNSTSGGRASASGDARLTHDALLVKGDMICLRESQDIRTVSQEKFKTYLEDGLKVLQSERDALGALKPPKADEAKWKDYLAKLDETIAKVKSAIKQPGELSQRNTFDDAGKLAAQARQIATKLGFKECGDTTNQVSVTTTTPK